MKKEATSCLLHATSIGYRVCEELVEECVSNARWFEEEIKKKKLHGFTKEGVNFKLTNKNKIIEVKLEYDLLGSILLLALQRKTNMDQTQMFTLTPVPLCLVHIDGLMQRIPKSLLLKSCSNYLYLKPLSILLLL